MQSIVWLLLPRQFLRVHDADYNLEVNIQLRLVAAAGAASRSDFSERVVVEAWRTRCEKETCARYPQLRTS